MFVRPFTNCVMLTNVKFSRCSKKRYENRMGDSKQNLFYFVVVTVYGVAIVFMLYIVLSPINQGKYPKHVGYGKENEKEIAI